MSNVLSPPPTPQLRLYDQLLQYPLFLGMSHTELMQLVGNTRFDFRNFGENKIIVHEGDTCTHLYFLMKGKISIRTTSDDHSYSVLEHISAPWMMEPESLFGLSTRYSKTVTAVTGCHFLLLSKEELMRLFDTFLTFRLNFLNLLSTLAQQRGHRFWRKIPQSLEEHITRFFIDHCTYPAGPKEFHILMTQLAAVLNDSRLDVSKALNNMQRSGLIELYRGRIIIPSLERLFM